MSGHIDGSYGQLAFLKEHLMLSLRLPGDVAEFGCYEGGTSRVMAEISGRPVHLFDSFGGLPEFAQVDKLQPLIWPGIFASKRETAEAAMQGLPHSIHEGLFRDTAPKFDSPICFAHIDCDLYESTKDAMNCCLRVLHPGGRVVLHDCCGQWGLNGMKAAMEEAVASGLWVEVGRNPQGPGQVALEKRTL